jgi:hypothetical protein
MKRTLGGSSAAPSSSPRLGAFSKTAARGESADPSRWCLRIRSAAERLSLRRAALRGCLRPTLLDSRFAALNEKGPASSHQRGQV